MKKLNKVFRTAEISFIDKYTIEHEPISSLDLMERAARTWAGIFCEKFGKDHTIIVVAGNGNNGGDGYAIARLLQEKGRKVWVYRALTEGHMSPDCEANFRRWVDAGNEVRIMKDWKIGPDAVIIDALFGCGLNRKTEGEAAAVIARINAAACPVVAVDIPSGLMGEDNAGNDPAGIVHATYTFTFQFPKVAFFLAENAHYVGEWQVLDIGLNAQGIAERETPYFYITEKTVREILPRPEKFAHKGTNGRGLLIAGSYGMMGAAVLSARAAVHSGVGLLHCHVPAKGGDILQITVPEAILDLDESDCRFTAVTQVDRYDAIAVGPALGKEEEMAAGIYALLTKWRGLTILDADALNILSEHKEWLSLLHENCVLTPHVKEFERLAGKSENDFDRLNNLSTFASRYQVYLVLKGAYSVVATPDGRLFFNMSGNPGMAKGGAGDVLTGILLALAANRMKLPDLLIAGVFAHGLSGDLVAEEQGYRGVCAGRIAEGVGKAWKRLEGWDKENRE